MSPPGDLDKASILRTSDLDLMVQQMAQVIFLKLTMFLTASEQKLDEFVYN